MPIMTIKSSGGSYSVTRCDDFAMALEKGVGGRNTFFIVDEKLFGLPYRKSLDGLDGSRVISLPAKETQKSFEQLTEVFLKLLEMGLRKDCELLCIGGGIIQDIGCFISSVLFRGMAWRYIPTTFLAQCDSCIGSKSSINIGRFKNQIGTFHAPAEVLLVPEVLETLTPDDIRSGMGEAIKLHLLDGEVSFRKLQQELSSESLTTETLGEIAWRSLEIKKGYIEMDEFDQGRRNLLNYGHTFGHAYESASHYAIPHGIAVSLGMATATFISARLGLVPQSHYNEIREILAPWHTPYEKITQALDIASVLSAMRMDKKNTLGKVNCILTRGMGQMEKQPVDPNLTMPALLSEFQAQL